MNKRLLDCELVLLSAMWGSRPKTMKQIIASVQERCPNISWCYKTYHSFLRKMELKGLIGSDTCNLKDKIYFNVITREQAIVAEASEIITRSRYIVGVDELMQAVADRVAMKGAEYES
ncbi:MAG: BlaI/MecI/CopY family transcriptional regulator [Christensenellales bacterium]|jgi:predicted transcriptional regulator